MWGEVTKSGSSIREPAPGEEHATSGACQSWCVGTSGRECLKTITPRCGDPDERDAVREPANEQELYEDPEPERGAEAGEERAGHLREHHARGDGAGQRARAVEHKLGVVALAVVLDDRARLPDATVHDVGGERVDGPRDARRGEEQDQSVCLFSPPVRGKLKRAAQRRRPHRTGEDQQGGVEPEVDPKEMDPLRVGQPGVVGTELWFHGTATTRFGTGCGRPRRWINRNVVLHSSAADML